MKQLILKGLGKTKVRKIIKDFLCTELIECFAYNNQEYTIYQGTIVYEVQGESNDDYTEFTLGELLEFVGNKI